MAAEHRVRQAQPADLDALCALEAATFSYDQLGRRSFAHMLRSPSAQVYVIEPARGSNSGELVGYAIILTRRGSHYWRLYSMAISAQARGLGLGKTLLCYLLEQAKPQAQGMRLEVKCDNQAGLALYRQLGFEVTDILPGYYSDGTDGYKMQLSWN
ncbi:N-acetyltransferase [Aliidiomarina sedimenti]|uniref:N-acetyltransferase n=1 Tax=Aliidiomarina sedimenti TaxID=1933879 RepID=A0ABY0BUZ8_9GAMM|nr:N-acetyltransferase [Aliidiomarina sedimenti]RUO28092.1 N-acetyltransferase [Aliidiomarina sedimenti]